MSSWISELIFCKPAEPPPLLMANHSPSPYFTKEKYSLSFNFLTYDSNGTSLILILGIFGVNRWHATLVFLWDRGILKYLPLGLEQRKKCIPFCLVRWEQLLHNFASSTLIFYLLFKFCHSIKNLELYNPRYNLHDEALWGDL